MPVGPVFARVGIYVNPVTWVSRHRLHHKFSDHPGDPNKLAADGFWRTLYLCLMPYECQVNMIQLLIDEFLIVIVGNALSGYEP